MLAAARQCEAVADARCVRVSSAALVRRVLPTTISHQVLPFGLHWSRHGAPIARASLRLIYSTGRWRMHGACSSLPPALVGRVLAATISRLHCGLHQSHHEQLVDRASGELHVGASRWRMQGACSSVTAAGTRVKSACHHDQTPAVWSALEQPWSSDCSSKLAAALWCEVVTDARCVLDFADGTRAESACCHDQTPAVWSAPELS